MIRPALAQVTGRNSEQNWIENLPGDTATAAVEFADLPEVFSHLSQVTVSGQPVME